MSSLAYRSGTEPFGGIFCFPQFAASGCLLMWKHPCAPPVSRHICRMPAPPEVSVLKFYIPSRRLRSSSDSRLLRIPSFRLKSFGQRKFSYQASVLWNSLPISLRHSNSTLAFKTALKTHLFQSQWPSLPYIVIDVCVYGRGGREGERERGREERESVCVCVCVDGFIVECPPTPLLYTLHLGLMIRLGAL